MGRERALTMGGYLTRRALGFLAVLIAGGAAIYGTAAPSGGAKPVHLTRRDAHPLAAESPAGHAKSRRNAPSRAQRQITRRLRRVLALGSDSGLQRADALLGRSTEGRRIGVRGWSGFESPNRLLVFGCIHGTECAATKVVQDLGRIGCPPYATLLAVPNLNPDGLAAATRLNGRGVDLNRNFPSGWRPIGQRYDLDYSGPHPFSEPETRLAARLIRLARPKVTIWFHQEEKPLVRAWGPSVGPAQRFAKLSGLPFYRLHWLAGTAPNWQNHRFPHTASFVVELPPGALSDQDAERYAQAVFDFTHLVANWRDR